MWEEDRLTRFEVARIISARALQISLGAPILVKTKESDPIKIAKEEFKKNVLPITIKRPLPSGKFQIVKIRKAIENWLRDYPDEF